MSHPILANVYAYKVVVHQKPDANGKKPIDDTALYVVSGREALQLKKFLTNNCVEVGTLAEDDPFFRPSAFTVTRGALNAYRVPSLLKNSIPNDLLVAARRQDEEGPGSTRSGGGRGR